MSSEKTNAQKTVIVIGGSHGIGAGVAKAFLHRGYSVVANVTGNQQVGRI